jgi:hypothetical protein
VWVVVVASAAHHLSAHRPSFLLIRLNLRACMRLMPFCTTMGSDL